MTKQIIVTGGAGFIGSCIVKSLNDKGITDIIIIDELGSDEKWKNLVDLKYSDYIDKKEFIDHIDEFIEIEAMVHMGACSATTEKDADYLMENNFKYSQKLYKHCIKNDIRFIYASSAATYGNGDLGYDDSLIDKLEPLNMYGYSKKLMDQHTKGKKCVGLRFFNVYGPREYHKENMASVIYHSFNQIKEKGYVKLFKSHKEGIKDGEQKRDFIYVKDVVSVILFMLENKEIEGIFNIGTGKARTFYDLTKATFDAMKIKPDIRFIDMPENLRDKYQYFTESQIAKLRDAGYKKEFFTLEEGAKDYIINYLSKR